MLVEDISFYFKILLKSSFIEQLFSLPFLFLALAIHQIAQVGVANRLRKEETRNTARFSLNPFVYFDIFGSIFVPCFLSVLPSVIKIKTLKIFGPIGWGKPIPVFSRRKYDAIKIALAGPVANFSVAIILALLYRLGSFFLIPVAFGVAYFIQLNILLAVVNLIPIPPLDGGFILFAFLPDSFRSAKAFFLQYGSVISLAVILISMKWIFSLSWFIFELIVPWRCASAFLLETLTFIF